MISKTRLLLVLFLASFTGLCCDLRAQEDPLKVFILVGQSNMQGHAQIRTLPHIGMDPGTRPILDAILDEATGEPRILKDVWVSYLSSAGVKTGQLTVGFGADENKIGPELTFGIFMNKRLGEPFLIIKTAWGGKSINTDFRPPAAGPYLFDQSVLDRWKEEGKDIETIKAEKEEATGVYYRQTVEHVKKVLADIKSVYPDYDAERGYELSGMVWFQGWNDLVDRNTYPKRGEVGGYDQYSEVLGHLIREFRQDLSAPDLPFVIGVLGVGGPTNMYTANQKRHVSVHQNFRDAMAAPASESEFEGNVVAVLTENCWDIELGALVARDDQIKGKLKKLKREGKLDQKDWQSTLKKERAEEFTESELENLNLGVSNGGYHYLGSSKILGQIGKAFAEAMPLGTGK